MVPSGDSVFLIGKSISSPASSALLPLSLKSSVFSLPFLVVSKFALPSSTAFLADLVGSASVPLCVGVSTLSPASSAFRAPTSKFSVSPLPFILASTFALPSPTDFNDLPLAISSGELLFNESNLLLNSSFRRFILDDKSALLA